jgi:hypothetical protein
MNTQELPTAIVTSEHEVLLKKGRRDFDWLALLTPQAEVSLFFWAFGMFLDDRKKPSMSRIMLAFWTWVGWRLMDHELHLIAGAPAIQNAVWTAWWAAEGVLCLAVFGPSVASYFGPGAAGAVAATAIGSATRDIMAARARAAALGEPGTEYDE